MRADGAVVVRRLLACLFGGVVLAMMVGNQEGTLTDFGVSFREAVLRPRIVIFLLIGLVAFVLITFWPLVQPYLNRPGVLPLGIGLITVLAGQTVMNWYDPLANTSGSGKFNAVRAAAGASPALSATTTAFFDWLAWTLTAVVLIGVAAAVVTRLRPIAYGAAAISICTAVLAYFAHRDVVDLGGGIDHSLGVYADVIGFVIVAGAAVTAVRSRSTTADTRAFIRAVTDFRPGLPLVAVGVVLGLFAFLTAGWFGTTSGINDTLSKANSDFSGTAVSALASSYLGWLGWTLFVVSAVVALITI